MVDIKIGFGVNVTTKKIALAGVIDIDSCRRWPWGDSSQQKDSPTMTLNNNQQENPETSMAILVFMKGTKNFMFEVQAVFWRRRPFQNSLVTESRETGVGSVSGTRTEGRAAGEVKAVS
ncbi:hypothetical protein ACRRTK_021126 [Alexandromys fortis]